MKFSFITGALIAVVALTLGLLPRSVQAVSASSLIEITGAATQDYFGEDIAVGDLNGDGYDDLVFGGYNTLVDSTRNGAIDILYGSASALTAQSITNSNVVRYTGEAEYDGAGTMIATTDLDADGYDDIIVGAPQNSGGASYAGSVYIIYGSSAILPGGSLAATVKLTSSQALQYFGLYLGNIGDIDGDGYQDVALGSPLYDSTSANYGATYILYGQSQRYTTADIDTVGTRLLGENAGDFLGGGISAAGDMNGDGYDDWIVGAYGFDGDGNNKGAYYVVYGAADRIAAGTISAIRLTGETSNDNAGYTAAQAGDINNDGYDDALVAVQSRNASTGSVYILYGGNTPLTTQSLAFAPQITGAVIADTLGYSIAADGSTIMIGAPTNDDAGDRAGSAYSISDQTSNITSDAINNLATTQFTGETADDLFGSSVILADLNGDHINEVVIGASSNSDAAELAGSAYIGYLRIDLDQDGVLSADGLLEQGTDCNDEDGTVSAHQTYYLDNDRDGLGVTTDTVSVCSSTPPDGYADNTTDTNDDIINNGVEINDDGVDNDQDGLIDEVNTLSDNEKHPEFGDNDPTDATLVAASLTSVRGARNGSIQVTFADDAVYTYTIFSGHTTKKVKIIQYKQTAYYIVLSPTGKKLALVNALNGRVQHRLTFKGALTYTRHHLQLAALRNDASTEVVIASQRGAAVRLVVVGVNSSTRKFVHVRQTTFELKGIVVNNTTVVNNTIDLRSKTVALRSILVGKNYHLRTLE